MLVFAGHISVACSFAYHTLDMMCCGSYDILAKYHNCHMCQVMVWPFHSFAAVFSTQLACLCDIYHMTHTIVC